MKDLGAVELAALVASGFTGEVITDFAIGRPEARVAVVARAERRIVGIGLRPKRCNFRRGVSVDPDLLRFAREVEAFHDRSDFDAGDIVALPGDVAGADEALVG